MQRLCNPKITRLTGITRPNVIATMRRVQTFVAMVFIGTVFLVVYSTLKLEMAYSHKVPQDRYLTTQLPMEKEKEEEREEEEKKAEVPAIPHEDVYNVSFSVALRETIPQNAAYWNRLLYSRLASLDKGDKPSALDTHWSHCRETNQESLQANMHDFASYSALLQTFVQGINCRTPSVLISQPDKCVSEKGKAHDHTFLLFAIKSNPKHFERRQAVRETWGKEGVYQNGLRVRLVFLLGNLKEDDPDLDPLVSFEAKHFRDILQWDFEESLLNLTLKMNMLLEWTVTNCSNVSFVFSGDDDVFVNTHQLLSYLQSLQPSQASQLYAGQIINSATPLRDPNNKYYIPVSFYDGAYPSYFGGGGFVISGTFLKPLHSLTHVIPFFPIDDVYVGMCFKALKVAPVAHDKFHTFDIYEKDRENLCVHKSLILVHRRSPRQLKKLWKGIQSPFLTC
ncbi:N-acetyllactosaminide beta-1,3-N-acetylglucosaminyltransferase 2 isoform X2 [Mugil cephalus]|uniref:N-acetyllactosaminide beta-1,3-N-acetylglucosaminyltransferase 2 isoform X2 n=1 Tax=Mugil cephalus TaxID=48193 RepID=UPI001FB5B2F3|nr:N-acetyllactosaminide beta-1,3-N-acetylglucosaminyltransferase 2 isoform X2 [Mugil cephalus]